MNANVMIFETKKGGRYAKNFFLKASGELFGKHLSTWLEEDFAAGNKTSQADLYEILETDLFFEKGQGLEPGWDWVVSIVNAGTVFIEGASKTGEHEIYKICRPEKTGRRTYIKSGVCDLHLRTWGLKNDYSKGRRCKKSYGIGGWMKK